MNLIKDLRGYVLEEKFKMNYLDNKLDIINYKEISHFDSNKIIVIYQNGSIVVSGKNLVVSKLLHDELLIEGNIDKIELR